MLCSARTTLLFRQWEFVIRNLYPELVTCNPISMPRKKAAWKHLRQTKRRTEQNRAVRLRLRTAVKKTRSAVQGSTTENLDQLLRETMQTIDKAARKGMIKKNTAARKKSRLQKFMNASRQNASGTR